MMDVVNNKEAGRIEMSKDLGCAQVVYSFYSMAGDEVPAGEPFVNVLAMWRAKRDREAREEEEACEIQARYEREVLGS